MCRAAGTVSSSSVNEINASEQYEDAAYLFQNNCSLGFFVPIHIALHKLSARSGKNNDGAMPDAVSQQKGQAVE